MKDDSGSYAVFTEQGSSASQMTAATVMDIISRLLGCAGQAADAVSAYTQISQRIPGTCEMLPRYRLQRINDEERLHRLKEWVMGRV